MNSSTQPLRDEIQGHIVSKIRLNELLTNFMHPRFSSKSNMFHVINMLIFLLWFLTLPTKMKALDVV